MKVLVTGGAGYLGSVLVPALLTRGCQVTVIDNFLYGQSSLLDCCHHEGFTVVRGDVRNRTLMEKQIQGADYIIPLACLVGAPLCDRDPVGARTINFEAIQMLLELRKPEQSIIFPTTNSGYGVGTGNQFCTEETPLNPISLYGRLKVEIEEMLLAAGNCTTLRLATVFGVSPRMRMDLLVNDFVWRALKDKAVVLFEAHFKRNYIHVRDVARAFLHCIDNFDAMKGQAYNVGLSDANLSKYELCQAIQKHIPAFVILTSEVDNDPDKRNYVVSNDKIERTGYRPQVSLDDGIRELLRGYQVLRPNQFANV
ncbi:MAG: NAD-dependent epimerase/dehydratase family protein [Candidatus Xenobia bacterium]